MRNLFSRTQLKDRIEAAFSDPQVIAELLGDVEFPAPLRQWLARLMLLQGVPINYLVPDEAMLPPESIRFFQIDSNWVDALIDGAFSIGRNLTTSTSAGSQTLEAAVIPKVRPAINASVGDVRAKAFGLTAPPPASQVICGFLLRSSVVTGYPRIQVNAYPTGGTPADPTIELLPILRFEQLGPRSDTIICLIDGDACQVDIHEPPEGLHYGIDSYACSGGVVQAQKNVPTFTQTGSAVTLAGSTSLPDLGSCFRTNAPRTLMMSKLAALIATSAGVTAIDSAQMGFEMTEGVGLVSFIRSTS
jgi:hypothetical protein